MYHKFDFLLSYTRERLLVKHHNHKNVYNNDSAKTDGKSAYEQIRFIKFILISLINENTAIIFVNI